MYVTYIWLAQIGMNETASQIGMNEADRIRKMHTMNMVISTTVAINDKY